MTPTKLTQALGDGFNVAEGSLPGASDEEPDGLIHATERRNVNGLPTNGSWAEKQKRFQSKINQPNQNRGTYETQIGTG